MATPVQIQSILGLGPKLRPNERNSPFCWLQLLNGTAIRLHYMHVPIVFVYCTHMMYIFAYKYRPTVDWDCT